MSRTPVIVAAAIALWAPVGGAENSPIDARNYAEGGGRVWVQRAVESAAPRLEAAGCQQLFSEFADREGVRIDQKLNELGVTPREYLTRWMWFMEGSRQPPCRNQDIAAFTHPGSRVVYVCSSRVVSNHIPDGDVVIIHEMLHSLGLPENPPTPAEITKRVRERCTVTKRLPGSAGRAGPTSLRSGAPQPHKQSRPT